MVPISSVRNEYSPVNARYTFQPLWVSGFIKTGTNWLYQIALEII